MNKTGEARKQAAQNIINQLSNKTDLGKDVKQAKPEIKQQVLNDTVSILQKIVNLNIPNSTDLNILGPASNILDSRNTKSWTNMNVS